MEVQFGPNPVDEPNLLYKLQRKIKVFNTTNSLPNRGYDLVASSSKYGLVFVASPDGTLSTYYIQQLIFKDCQKPQHFDIGLQEKPTHISVSCDQELLAVTGGQTISVYQISHFSNQNVKPMITMKTETSPAAMVSALQWNPCIPDTLAMAFLDGTLLVAQINGQVKKVQATARCICWSPKGKQLVVGNSDGTLCQYKPDLSPTKSIPAPNIFNGAPAEAVAIYWISTYQFAVVYRNASDNSRPAVTIVNTPKGAAASCLNYEDVCYSNEGVRPWYYYLTGLPQWNMILAASSNSMEIATLGSTDGANWSQWTQSDEARPELPLTDKKQENYPVGVCLDTAAVHQLPWGENEVLPYMPQLLVLSHSGSLTVFNVISTRPGASLCSPPQQLSLPAGALSTTIPGEAPPEAQAVPQPTPQQAPPAYQPAPAAAANQPSLAANQPAFAANQPAFGANPPAFAANPPAFGANPPAFAANQPALASSPATSAYQAPPPAQNRNSFTQQSAQGFQALSSVPSQSQESRNSAPIVVPTPQPAQPPQPTTPVQRPTTNQAQTPEVNAALKAEQERANIQRANQELKNMLIKEVNDFQTALYEFRVKTRELQIQTQTDLNSLDAPFELTSLDADSLQRQCSLEELRGAVATLKLELVRACAVLAEARSHAEAKDYEWTEVDPLSTKRLASVKKLAYYVQNQLQQAQKALDHKWNEINVRDAQRNQPGAAMTRPLLDAVYQPLVQQQELLARQAAALRTLRTAAARDTQGLPKTASLLRSTPFRKDPLSKLTKNILNMSIEQKDRANDNGLSNQKLEALRDMLSNHKTVKIKPVNIELSEHLKAMRLNYEKSVKEKGVKLELTPMDIVKEAVKEKVKIEPTPGCSKNPDPVPVNYKVEPVSIKKADPQPAVKVESKPTAPANGSLPVVKQEPKLPSTPTSAAAAPVVRTLFTDEPEKTPQTPSESKPFSFPSAGTSKTAAPISMQPTKEVPQAKSGSSNDMPSESTRSVLKNLLINKQSEANTFMGQKICSPSAFASPANTSTSAFTVKPVSEISTMMSKYQTSTKPEDMKIKSFETGEPEATGGVVIIEKKDGRSAPFSVKNVPDLVKPNVTVTKVEKKPEKSKENVQEKKETKPFSIAASQASSAFASPQVTASAQIVIPKPKPTKPEAAKEKPEAKPAAATASSIFAAGNAATTAKPTSTETPAAQSKPTSAFSSPATPSSVFGAVSQPSSIFSSTTSTSVFGNSSPSSIFASATSNTTTTQSSDSSTTQSVFGTSKTPQTPSSVFGTATKTETPTPASVFGATKPETPTTSVFGTPTKTEAQSPASVFAAANKTEAPSPSSVFGEGNKTPTATPSSVFGSATQPESPTPASVFGAAKTESPSVFGTPTKTETPTTQSVFGSPTPKSVFGNANATTTSAFATTTTTQSIFGAAPATTQPSIFGSPSSQSSVFGASTTQSLFGSPATTQASIFGGTPATQAGSVFGAATPTTAASVFGTATTQSSVFGTPPPTTQASIFGATTQSGSVFGAATPATQGSVFGSSTTQAGSVFGTTATTQASIFGGTTTTQSVFGATTTSSSLFGESNLFASASISTTSASPSGGSIFGGGGTSAFGNASPTTVFGGKSSFAQPAAASSIFGGGAAFGQKPPANLWAGGTTTNSAFGTSPFGQTTQAPSAFGGSFTATSPAQAFSTPAQPTGSVFGSPQQQQSAPGFGGSPGFGSKPAFGQPAGFGSPTAFGQPAFGGGFNKSPGGGFGAAPAFGSSATFGGAPAFGSTSPGSVFGAAAPSFAASTQSNATFESLATQDTLTFGNLAQHSPAPPAAAPTFNTSPSFTGWRG